MHFYHPRAACRAGLLLNAMAQHAHDIMDRWTWSLDDAEAVPALLALPRAREIGDAILGMCVRNNSLTPATLALVRKYAARDVADSALRDRVLRVCAKALRFLPSHAFLALEAIYRFDAPSQEIMDACVPCISPEYPLNVRMLAMHVVARVSPARVCDDLLIDSFDHMCDLVTSHSVTAPALLARVSGHDVDFMRRALICCVSAGNCTRPAVDLAMDLADERPELAVAIGAMQIILKAGFSLPDNVITACWATLPLHSRHELLVYLVKFGIVPPGAERIWADVLSQCTIKTKILYASFLSDRARLVLPPAALPPFRDTHVGCIRLAAVEGDSVDVLLCLLARHAEVFACAHSWNQADFFNTQSTLSTVMKMRDLVYYFTDVDVEQYTLEDAHQLVLLADMIGARAILRFVLHRMATLDFWAAWDLAHEWPDAKIALKCAAQEQLPVLVRCSRMSEIAAFVAGCS